MPWNLVPIVLAIASGAFTLWHLARTRDKAGALTLAAVLVPALLWRLVPEFSLAAYQRLNYEDGAVEWATALSFLVAAGIFLARAKRGAPSRWTALAWASLGLLCFFVAGEELSWGQRLFAIAPPPEFIDHNRQFELNLHNLSRGVPIAGVRFDATDIGALFALVYGGLLPLCRAWLLRARASLLRALGEATPPPLLSAAYLTVPAILFNYTVKLGAELAELVLGLCFLATAASLYAGPKWHRLPTLVGAVLLGGVWMPWCIDHLTADDPVRRAQAEAELAALRDDFLQGRAKVVPEMLFENRVEVRLSDLLREDVITLSSESAFREVRATGRTRSPELTSAELGLDPWNNPYILIWHRQHHRMFIFSFGNNRRRDGDYPGPQAGRFDDIGVELDGRPWVRAHLQRNYLPR